ncbi:hypothetical protein RN001_000253 [Aquatica leii]|uniref:Uncharacterized protein n=1 Tax=Aquatica leii TaxID=1421715 RepID=A0AAN7SJ34_9COLE|nr:hypothetical protein RN001_000253 [Aquatica leii]
MVSLTIYVCAILIICQANLNVAQFPDLNSQFSQPAVPRDPSQARQLLGYNKYDRAEVRNSDKQVYYGNNWEQFL